MTLEAYWARRKTSVPAAHNDQDDQDHLKRPNTQNNDTSHRHHDAAPHAQADATCDALSDDASAPLDAPAAVAAAAAAVSHAAAAVNATSFTQTTTNNDAAATLARSQHDQFGKETHGFL